MCIRDRDETAGVAEADGATVCWPASAIPTTEAAPRMTTNTAAAIIPAAGVNCFNRFLPVRPPGLRRGLAQNCRAGYWRKRSRGREYIRVARNRAPRPRTRTSGILGLARHRAAREASNRRRRAE